jgi:Na+(H+)/acetate symporter ActP
MRAVEDLARNAQSSNDNTEETERFLGKILSIVYIISGVVVAASHHHFVHLNALKLIASALLAAPLWPLVLFGVSLHLH